MNPAERLRFKTVVGIGAIGAGVVFRLEGDHDLGRNESRAATLLKQRDYFKLHIVLHYLARLTREAGLPLDVVPISAVGNDDNGRRLVRDMREEGMDVHHVEIRKELPTVFGVCFVYPDGSGGNVTAINAASGLVDPKFALRAAKQVPWKDGRCLVLAAPEVSLDARRTLLHAAREHGAFTVASYLSAELRNPAVRKDLHLVDLLALNLDEAASLSGLEPSAQPEEVVRRCAELVSEVHAGSRLSVTNGRSGAYAWEAGRTEFLPALDVPAAGTAGAGDAMLAGCILGLTLGLPFLGSARSCFRLGRLLAAMSVTAADTINFDVHLSTLRAFAKDYGEELPV